MRPGRFKQVVTLQSRVETSRDDFGGVNPAWSIESYRHAMIEPITGREYLQAQAVQADVTHRITMRSDEDTRRLTPKWRLGLEGTSRTFDIVSVIDVGERRRELEVMVAEKVV